MAVTKHSKTDIFVWTNLQVGLLRCPQPQQGVAGEVNHQGHGKSNEWQRRKIRSEAASSNTVTEEVTEVIENTAKKDANVQEAAD